MATDSIGAVTERHAFDTRRARACNYCGETVHWMLTRFGTRRPFDADLLPAKLMTHGIGWIPGTWPIRGREVIAMAPHEHYGQAKRDRVSHVATLHQCRAYLAHRRAA